MRDDERMRRARAERVRARQRLVGDDAERVEIGAMVDVGVAERLLGRHVRRRPERHAGRGERRPRIGRGVAAPSARGHAHGARDAEVGDHGVTVGEEDVLGLHVPVHDAVPVRMRERVGDVAHDAPRLGERQRPAGALQAIAERLAGGRTASCSTGGRPPRPNRTAAGCAGAAGWPRSRSRGGSGSARAARPRPGGAP